MTSLTQQSPATTADTEARPSSAMPLVPKRKPRRRRSPWPMRIAIVLVLALVGVLAVRGSKPKPILVETRRVERGTIRDEISSSSAGEVMAEQRAIIRAELSGSVVAVQRRTGERVKKDELILELDAGDLNARLRQARATWVSQHSQVAQAEARAESARRTAERAQNLHERGAETKQIAEDAAAQANEAAAAAAAARAQLDQAEAALQVARVARSKTVLTAPFDGLLADVAVDPGAAVQPGMELFEIIDDSRLHVEATIDEADIGRVQVGQVATLRLDALPERSFEAVVAKLNPTVRKDAKGARSLGIEVEVKDLAGAVAAGVRPGMSANVDVRVDHKEGVLSVPTSAIVGRGTKRSVYVVESGVARERQLITGISNWEQTEVVSGLKEGEEIVTTLNAKGLADGVAVQLTSTVEKKP
jgi:HlyD family secretion protein